MKSLNRKECLALLQKYQVPEHIISHSLRVAQVGMFISRHLKEAGENLDIGLIETGGLLHDITKWKSIQTKEDHALSGFELLKSLGYERIADIVRQHVHLDENIKHNSLITEALIVNYSDKRVKHTSVVNLSERFNDILIRYGTDEYRQKMIKKLYEEITEIELLIFNKLEIEPARLNVLNRFEPKAKVKVEEI
jgi:putative nucleotidyltransferase with HDIG domain